MAKRTLRPQHTEEIRAKIKGSQLTRLVQEYALTGKFNGAQVEPKRVDAALGLLRKLLPDLASTTSDLTVKRSYLDVLAKAAELAQVGDQPTDEPVEQRNIH